MEKLTEEQLDFIREDLASDMGYTKIIMIGKFLKKLKEKEPDLSGEEILERLEEFRRERGWDE